MKTIHITVSDKIARNLNPTDIVVCGNTDYVVEFTFDAEWNTHYTKTARFVTANGYFDVLFDGNTCAMPMFSNVNCVEVGVYAGDLATTTRAYVPLAKSILCGNEPMHPDPPEDVYNQICEKLNKFPSPTDSDNGKVLGVSGGEYSLLEYSGGGGSGGGVDFVTDETLSLVNGVLSVNTADAVEQDNTLPITSAAVHTTVGNIEILLQTI